MKIKKMLITNKIVKAMEVSKKELFDFIEKYNFISISKLDLNLLDTVNDSEIVGAIFGDIEAIDDASFINPDCWFVNREFINKNYKDIENSYFNFSEALVLLKKGYMLARKNWNEKDIFIFLVPINGFKIKMPNGTEMNSQQCIYLKTTQNNIIPWMPSQSDILAEDWFII